MIIYEYEHIYLKSLIYTKKPIYHNNSDYRIVKVHNKNIIIVAMQKEADYIIKGLNLIKNNNYYENETTILIVTGIGLVNVIQVLLEYLKNNKIDEGSKIINVGLAGSTKYKIGDIISVEKSIKYNKSNTIKENDFILNSIFKNKDVCYTADDFIENIENIPLIDMELYYICLFFKNVISLKLVSDNLSLNQYNNFDKNWKNLIIKLKEVLC